MSLAWNIVTPHYPPQEGGIAEYTFAVTKALSMSGDSVSVWCPEVLGEIPEILGVRVHRIFRGFGGRDLHRLNQIWKAAQSGERRILLMYHPHGFGWHSLNLPFCFWLWTRAAFNGDRLVIILHEYAIDFKPWKFYVFATFHRLMLATALRGAARVWSPVECWVHAARVLALGRTIPVEWLPVFSTIPFAGGTEEVQAVRNRFLREGELLIGHFGTCPPSVTRLLDQILLPLLRSRRNCKVLLMGSSTDRYASALGRAHPDLTERIRGLGAMAAPLVSIHLRACDLLVQPYFDGVNARRSSAMAALENGVPLITTHGRTTEPFWREVSGTRLVPVEDAKSAIRVTEELLDDPHTRASMSLAARSYYAEHFSLELVVERLRACEEAADKSKKAAASPRGNVQAVIGDPQSSVDRQR